MAMNPMTAAAMRLRLRRRRLVVAVVAIIVSIGLHVIVAIYFPAAWIYGDIREPSAPTDPEDKRIFEVDLQPEEWRRAVDMEYLRITSREIDPEGVEPLDIERDWIDPAVFEPDLSPEALLDDELLADDDFLEAAPLIDIGPGQEIIEITDRVVSEPETAFQRAISPDVKRVRDALDIVVPGTVEEFRHLAEAAGTRPARLSEPGDLTDVDSDIWRPRIDGTGETGWPTRSEAVDDLMDRAISDIFGETADDVTDLRPVERYLSLRVKKYTPSDDHDDLFFAIAIERHEGDTETGEPLLDVLPKDVLYIQDLSGSMGQHRVSACRDGIVKAMEHLREQDRFNIVSFSHVINQHADDWVAADEQSIRQAQPFLDNMASGGFTDLKAALVHAIDMERDHLRPNIALLLTDGLPPNVGETNTTQIIENLTKRNRGKVSFFAASTGWWDDDDDIFLLDMLTYRNRGEARLLRGALEDMPDLIDNLAHGFSRPVLTDLRYYFTRDSESEVYPLMLSNLYLDRPLILHGRIPKDKERLAFQVVGRSGEVLYDFVFEIPIDEISEGDRRILNQWARHRVYYLIAEHMRTGKSAILRELFNTSRQFNMEIPYLEDFAQPSRFRRW